MSVRLVFRQCHPSLFFFLLSLMLVSPSTSDELEHLLNFKSALNSSNSSVFNSWTPENPVCSFTGIVCNVNGFIKEINLPQQQLAGVLPFHSICGLQSLEKISMGNNFFHGFISDDLKNCRNLKELDLGKNSFSGELPDLSSLHELKFLSLNMSGFSGSFPWNSLNNLTNLEFLSLGDNPFVLTDSFPVELLKRSKLQWLYLSNCSIRGQIPEGISNLTQLRNLELSDNQVFGEIPEGIGKLSKLWQFEIYNNSLTGKLPGGFGNLTSLVNFDASTNHLEGNITVLRSLKLLSSLQLFENQFSGEIPEEFGELKHLTGLSLYNNKFTGTLPQKIGSLGDLSFVDVSENFFSGPIPPDMCKNGKMTDLLVMQNNFSGRIPESYSNCKSLIRLRVNNNSLSGCVPAGMWGLPDLIVADLSMNRFEGQLTPDIGNAKSLSLLILTNNRFSGELPTSFSDASCLVSVQLSLNQFSGQIPESIGQLKRLTSIYLNENRLSGTIPVSLGSCVSLTVLELSGNAISGKIPETLGKLSSLNSLILSNNKLLGEIPVSLSSLRLSNLDLSNNQLFGPIPESLSLKVFRDGFEGNPGLCSNYLKDFRSCSTKVKHSSHLRVLLSCLAAGVFLVLVISAVYLLTAKSRTKTHDHTLKGSSWAMKTFQVLSFSEKDVVDAIHSENLIGKGGSGNVYKVSLGNGNEFAVKHIWTSNLNDRKTCRSSSAILTKCNFRSPEYEAEIAALSAVRHMNVVKLYCSMTSEDSNLLVYEYLPNGSLWDQLHSCNKTKIGWELRYAIAVGAAKGLEYLHHGCNKPVIHRDVKSSNILLDEEWRPRIADFGLAKIVQTNGADWSHHIVGTHGYMPPEYAYSCKVTEKSDVYSFGVVLMELVTGKKPVEPEFGENKDIVHWVCSKISNKESALDVMDPNITEDLKEDAIEVLRIAVHCTARLPVLRPTMRIVVSMLEDAEPHQPSEIFVDEKEDESRV